MEFTSNLLTPADGAGRTGRNGEASGYTFSSNAKKVLFSLLSPSVYHDCSGFSSKKPAADGRRAAAGNRYRQSAAPTVVKFFGPRRPPRVQSALKASEWGDVCAY
jgi:hypothetical protein